MTMILIDLTPTYGNAGYDDRPGGEAAIKYFTAHHSETPEPQTLEEAEALIASIDEFHREVRGWPGIAYQRAAWRNYYFLIKPRKANGYHTGAGGDSNHNGIGDANDFGLACVLLGTYTTTTPSDELLQTVAEGKNWDEAQMQREVALKGHQDFMATACPGQGWPWWSKRIAAYELQVAPDPEPVPTPPSSPEPTFSDLVNALGYLCGDVADTLVNSSCPEAQAAAAEMKRVGAQFGVKV